MCLCAWKHKAAGDTDRVARSPVFKELKWLVCYHYHSKRDFPIPSRQRWHVSGRRPADSRAGKPLQSFFLNFSPSLVLTPSVGLYIWGRGGCWCLLCACVGCRRMGVTHTEGGRVGAVTTTAWRNGDFLKTWKNGLSKRITSFQRICFFDKCPTCGS